MKTATALVALVCGLLAGAAGAAPSPEPTRVSGQVLEVQTAGDYTYLRLKTAAGETWAAVPASTVSIGATVTIGDPMTMHDFESRTLKRRFDRIVFGTIDGPAGMVAAAPMAAPTPTAAAAPKAAPAAPAAASVTKAEGPDAKTVAEVATQPAALAGKTVVVRGTVVKFNGGIMGKNFVHLRDGTGSEADGSNDLLVLTLDQARVGDVVSATGTVRANVSFGSGYSYSVLVEGAALRK
ncbi:nucleotide-binding protein [Ideonella sp. A 288]|uniref:nucleotide-binding protein n=1 Tax=Ideonella sp. A 288 TaxID=1962181 RepID=UPI0011854107|nr:nucleotide-binding protein [Ideonella sp. A 288]